MPQSDIAPQNLAPNRIAAISNALEMSASDLENIVALAEAIWVDERAVGHHLYETYVAAILTERDPAAQVIKISQALLLRAERADAGSLALPPELRLTPFYRLAPADRALLAVSHSQRWSYEKLGKIFQCSGETLESRLWQARLQLVVEAGALESNGISLLGGPKRGLHCPEYAAMRPWTQRFLDGEIPHARERAFLQNHLMACAGCQKTLYAARDIYYRVDQLIPRSKLAPEFSAQLTDVSRQTLRLAMPGKMSFAESLIIFSRRPEVRAVLAGLGALVIYSLFFAN